MILRNGELQICLHITILPAMHSKFQRCNPLVNYCVQTNTSVCLAIPRGAGTSLCLQLPFLTAVLNSKTAISGAETDFFWPQLVLLFWSSYRYRLKCHLSLKSEMAQYSITRGSYLATQQSNTNVSTCTSHSKRWETGISEYDSCSLL